MVLSFHLSLQICTCHRFLTSARRKRREFCRTDLRAVQREDRAHAIVARRLVYLAGRNGDEESAARFYADRVASGVCDHRNFGGESLPGGFPGARSGTVVMLAVL